MAYKRTNIYIPASVRASIYTSVHTHTSARKRTCTHIHQLRTNTLFLFAEVKDIVHAVMYLLSDKADMINGVTLDVDGGLSAC